MPATTSISTGNSGAARTSRRFTSLQSRKWRAGNPGGIGRKASASVFWFSLSRLFGRSLLSTIWGPQPCSCAACPAPATMVRQILQLSGKLCHIRHPAHKGCCRISRRSRAVFSQTIERLTVHLPVRSRQTPPAETRPRQRSAHLTRPGTSGMNTGAEMSDCRLLQIECARTGSRLKTSSVCLPRYLLPGC